LTEEQIDKILSLQVMKETRGISMVLGVGQGNQPIYSNAVIVMRVDDSKAFMASYENSIKKYNEIIKDVHSQIFQPLEAKKAEVKGISSLQITKNIPEPPKDQKTPQYTRMMEAMLGPGDKITTWLVPVNKNSVVIGFVNKDFLQQTIEAIKKGKPDLANNAEVAKTAALLSPEALSVIFVSPAGVIELIKQVAPAIAPPEAKLDQKLPEFPKTPPIGLAVTTTKDELQTCLVVPFEVLKAIPQYVLMVQAMQSGAMGSTPEKLPAQDPQAKEPQAKKPPVKQPQAKPSPKQPANP